MSIQTTETAIEEIYENDGYRFKTHDGEFVSLADIGKSGKEIDPRDAYVWFEDTFGVLRSSEAETHEVLNSFANSARLAAAYKIDHCKLPNGEDRPDEDLLRKTLAKMVSLESYRGVYRLLNHENMFPKEAKIMKELLIATFMVGYVKKEIGYSLEELEAFSAEFNAICGNALHTEFSKKNGFKDSKGRIVETVLMPRDVKFLDRILDKLFIRPENEMSDVNDIIGGRIFVAGQDNIQKTINKIKKSLGCYNFELKEKANKNRGEGFDEVIFLIGKIQPKGKEKKPISIELQIINKDKAGNYDGVCEDHHDFYSQVIQACVRECRLDNNDFFLREEVVKDAVEQFVKKPDVIDPYTQKEARNRFWERFNRTFFKYDGSFYSYQNILRLREKDLRDNHTNILGHLFWKFNVELGTQFETKEWLSILNSRNPEYLNGMAPYFWGDILKNIKGVPAKILGRVEDQARADVNAAIV